jgi:dihydroxy-acid dehydratase
LVDGDQITIDAERRTVDVDLSSAELEHRRAQWHAPATTAPLGVLRKYSQLVSSASLGAVTTRQ